MKKCLIVIDYQNDFIDGALGFEGGLKIKNKILSKISSYRKNKDDIIFTKDTHDETYLQTEEGKHLDVIHCVKGTHGHELQRDVLALKTDEDVVFEKHTFPSLELGNYLKAKDYQEVELCGLVSNICVISNAIIAKAALPNAHIFVDALATASADEILHKKSLDVMEGLHIEVRNNE
ncbi:MAG: cysteine hydrolase family protein [Candidatus Izemoplasmatales bacterium]